VIVAIVALRYVELRCRWIGTTDGFDLLVKVIGAG
jgi:hypothetical protein